MAQKVVLVGNNEEIIDIFFNSLYTSFDMLTSSSRFEDIENHIKVFSPSLVIFCTKSNPEDFAKLDELFQRLPHDNCKFILIGAKQAANDFQKRTIEKADLVIYGIPQVPDLQQALNLYIKDNNIPESFEPPKEEKPEPSPSAAQPSVLQTAVPAKPQDTKRKHVLVIDDDLLMLKVIKEYLHDFYDVATAKSGEIAYKFLRQKQTDMLIIDYAMPEEDGLSVLQHIRHIRGMENVPAVFLTGVTDKTAISRALALGIQGYLLKPVDRQKLLAKLNEVLNS